VKAVLQYRASEGFRAQIYNTAPDWLDVAIVDEADKAESSKQMQDTDVLLHVLEPVTAEAIGAAPTLRLIQKIGVGVNTIDLGAAQAHGAAVCNMPGTNSRAVAEMTLTLMFAALRRVSYFDPRMRGGDGWNAELDAFDGLGEIAGRTIGLVGYGDVARILAPILTAMDARVLYTATTRKNDAHAEWRELSALLRESDIVSLHLPLTDVTAKVIDNNAILAMKPGAILINTARGGLVDEAALIDALKSGHLRAAGLDVVTDEPAPAGNPLFDLANVVVMPHIAWLTPETLHRSLGIAFENCRRLRDGEVFLHRIV
jgi:phosphoglycerate dehydrogenase-like enzyme